MKRINLRDIYPFYECDQYIPVDDAVAELLEDSRKAEKAYQRRLYRYKAYYSLDRCDGIEHETVLCCAFECHERQATNATLYKAIASLPGIQAKRIYAHYFLGMSRTDIARAEGVSVKAVCTSITRGMECLERELKKQLE